MLNLTPHAITIRTESGDITLQLSGTVARVTMDETPSVAVEIDGIQVPTITRKSAHITGLPADGTPCIVSSMVLDALPSGTAGVYAPDTGATAIRNDKGHIIAVTRLVAA